MNGYSYWSVSWAVPHTNADGMTVYWYETYSAQDEHDARSVAWMRSRPGHATVSNRDGLVVTYVDGHEWVPAGTIKAGGAS